ncbi:MAG: flavin reductase [Spirochaetales bacterium]
MQGFTQIAPKLINENAVKLIGDDWALVTAGVLPECEQDGKTWNTMTASWGGLGFLWNEPVAFVFVRPQRFTYEFTEKHETMTLSFFSEEYRKALQFCGIKSGRDFDKAKETGLTPIKTQCGCVAFAESSLILETQKLYTQMLSQESFLNADIIGSHYLKKDFHRMYVCKITSAWIK